MYECQSNVQKFLVNTNSCYIHYPLISYQLSSKRSFGKTVLFMRREDFATPGKKAPRVYSKHYNTNNRPPVVVFMDEN